MTHLPAAARRPLARATALTALIALTGLHGCAGRTDGGALPRPETPPAPLASCAALQTLALPDTALTVEAVAAGTTVGPIVTPAHCVVRGRMHPRTGEDGRPYFTGFELRLPLAWNGRFVFQGGGGNDGVIRPALGSLAGDGGALAGLKTGALARGYAVVSTDAGHQGLDATFGRDAQARIDHAWRSYHRVTLASKSLIVQAYGVRPERSYFLGCSGGGRQALLFPQRFPELFDGVVAHAPAMKVAREASVASIWAIHAYRAAAPRDAAGQPILSAALSDADLARVSGAILERCDALDGATDGIVSVLPAACRFDPSVLRCTGAKTDGCLSAAQVAALAKDFGGPRDSAGRALYASWPWDPGLRGADWRRWKLGTAPGAKSDARNVTLIAEDAVKWEFLTPPDPDFDPLRFDFDRDPARMDAYAAIYHTVSTDVAAFRARGGKMLLIHGAADPIFSANDTIDWYERLAEAEGGLQATSRFARLFVVPGMNHCSNSGGPATDLFDALAPLADWVERGIAPQRIVAQASASAPWPGRTRPLCPYPTHARYVGSGSLEDAANFRCER